MKDGEFRPGDILWLEISIPSLPYPAGYWVLHSVSELHATVSLVSQDQEGLCSGEDEYTLLREDLAAFISTGKRARIK